MDDARSRTVILSSFCKFPLSFLFRIYAFTAHLAAPFEVTNTSFFLEQGPITGSRKIGTYLGPLKITLSLLSSLPDLLLSWHVRKTGENFRRQLEASLPKRSTLTISGRLFEFSSHCLAIEHGTRKFTRNASSWIVARKNAAISCRKSRTGPRLCSLECHLFFYYFLLSNGKRNGRSK